MESFKPEHIIDLPKPGDFIDMKIPLPAGAKEYRAINSIDQFPVFSVVFDSWSGSPPPATDGASIVWGNQMVCLKGRWWNAFFIENKSEVAVSVVVRTKSL